ncbi:unnamed protein product [Arabidopsis lyrata]|nr:unnamed protein product [Arabidopsis lyrata]
MRMHDRRVSAMRADDRRVSAMRAHVRRVSERVHGGRVSYMRAHVCRVSRRLRQVSSDVCHLFRMRERSSPINRGSGSLFLGEGGVPEGEEALPEAVCRCSAVAEKNHREI